MGLKIKHISASNKRICVGITMGDPSGIGPEIIAKALDNLKLRRLADFMIIGDEWVFLKATRIKHVLKGIEFLDLKNVNRKNFSFGKIEKDYGRASMEYIKKALELIKKGKINCLVTAPISKEAINLAGYRYPGHTEYLAEFFDLDDVAMMLVAKRLKVALVTRHIPLKVITQVLNSKDIYKTIKLTFKGLKDLFNIKQPSIAVCGLNPHASDGGLLGDEEERIIKPAINLAKDQNISIDGPFPSDTVFYRALQGEYHAVIAMYHDQGLIPIKMMGFNKVVNFTLGLPFVRTSPGHGTAFKIAGKQEASSLSMQEAIRLAIKCSSIYNFP